MFKRKSREEGEGRGFSIMKFEICRTSKASVAKPLWQQSRGVHRFPSAPPLPPVPLLSFSPSLPVLKCVSPELGERLGRG